MGSAVSSERAFSAAGITISKRRNRLKADIVEALQFLKCSFRENLIFPEQVSSNSEVDLDEVEMDDENPEWVDEDPSSWDNIIDVDTDDE
jgi:hypothetical protein